jgi:hypothetical protein
MNDATQSRRRMLIKAVHDAALELAARRYTTAPLDDNEPTPDEPVIMVSIEGATPKPNPKMLAISSRAIFERVRLTIPNVRLEEVQNTIMQSLSYKGGRRQ